MPAFTILTPKGNYFPIPIDVNLGDRKFAQTYMEEHLLNFTKGILPHPELEPSEKEYLKRHDIYLLERLGNTRSLHKGNFAETVLSKDFDVAVLVYTSDSKSPHI